MGTLTYQGWLSLDIEAPQTFRRMGSVTMKRILLVAAGVMLLSHGARAHVATISGGYDLNSYDTPELLFNNTSAYDFTNAQIVLTGYQGVNNGLTDTVALPNITAGTNYDLIWTTLPAQSPFFVNDYDDTAAGTAPCPPNPVNSGLCGDPGNFYVTFTATWDGQAIYSQFSPATNASGGFVGWEGLNPNGVSEDPVYDNHNGSVTGVLAYIDVGTPPPIDTPEPATLALFGTGLAVFGLVRRRKSA